MSGRGSLDMVQYKYKAKHDRNHENRDSRAGVSFRTVMLSRNLRGYLCLWGMIWVR